MLAFMWRQDETLVYTSLRQTKKNATLSHTHTHTHTIQSNPPTRWFAPLFSSHHSSAARETERGDGDGDGVVLHAALEGDGAAVSPVQLGHPREGISDDTADWLVDDTCFNNKPNSSVSEVCVDEMSRGTL